MSIAIWDISVNNGGFVFRPSVMEIFRLALVEEKAEDRNAFGFSVTPSRVPSVSSQKKMATSWNCLRSRWTTPSCSEFMVLLDRSGTTSLLDVQEDGAVLAYTVSDAYFGPFR